MNVYTFGEKLKKTRLEKGLKQSELGDLVGTNQQNIARWENSETIPRRKNIILLCNALKVRIDNFFSDVSITEKEAEEVRKAAIQQKNADIEQLNKLAHELTEHHIERQKELYFEKELTFWEDYKSILHLIETAESQTIAEQLKEICNNKLDKVVEMIHTELLFLKPYAIIEIKKHLEELLFNPANTTDEYKQLLEQSENKTE